jgi:glycosyltransferase involved in cell wall biosynthesis
MATGTPVVQPARGAYIETIERTGGGLLVELTVHALADGLLKVAQDPGLARALGTKGAAGVREHYSVAREADRLLDVYGTVLGR